MCLAIPALVTELLDDAMARVSLDGVTKVVSVALVEDVRVGDYIVLHVGYALAKINEAEAQRTLKLMREAAAVQDEAPVMALPLSTPPRRDGGGGNGSGVGRGDGSIPAPRQEIATDPAEPHR